MKKVSFIFIVLISLFFLFNDSKALGIFGGFESGNHMMPATSSSEGSYTGYDGDSPTLTAASSSDEIYTEHKINPSDDYEIKALQLLTLAACSESDVYVDYEGEKVRVLDEYKSYNELPMDYKLKYHPVMTDDPASKDYYYVKIKREDGSIDFFGVNNWDGTYYEKNRVVDRQSEAEVIVPVLQQLPYNFAPLDYPPLPGPFGEGKASWYGGDFEKESLNKTTANGEIFNPEALTCASWYYPFGTKLRITNLANGESIEVRVNDRGPNRIELPDRIIDLTRRAFREIADSDRGLIDVRVEVIEE